ncbi:ABC transporter ATP-binding protein [Rhodococcus sp. NPDC003348]
MAADVRGSVSAKTAPESRADGPAVRVRGLRKSFGERAVLGGVDLEIRPDEIVALLGRSGGGKSTLLRVLAGLDTDYTGEVAVPAARSVVFQEPRLFPWKSVWRNVVTGLGRRPDRALAMTALEEVGLTGRADAWPATLSGGEAQRVALARALVREPRLVLLDEPFGALDALTRIRMHEFLAKLCLLHRPAVLLVTHDVDEALALADRVLVLGDGAIAVDHVVDVPRPRRRSDPDLIALRAVLLDALGVDSEHQL